MRLHLWLRLFLAFALLSGAALFGFAAWQQHGFRRGFIDYLDQGALQRLAPAAARLAAAYVEHGGWDFLREDPRRFGEYIEGRDAHDNQPPEPESRPEPPPDERGAPHDAAPFGNRPPPPGAPPPRDRPRPPRGPPDLMPRLLLVDIAGERVSGNPRVAANAAAIPILVDGKAVGALRLAPMPQLSDAGDVAFAQSQLHSALLAGAVVLIGALLFAFALARWLLAPVRALTAGTRALAAGDFMQRIGSARNDELGALSRDFDHLAATLEQHRNARRQWGADIAHELRTPLAILRGEIQALQDGVRPLTLQALESLHGECERLGHLIDDLYQLSLADAGALEYRFETLDLAQLVDEALELQRPACSDAGLRLEAKLARGAMVNGDARRLAQLLDNLLVNARRYTNAPGTIRVTLGLHAAQIRLMIEDTPPGVPAAALPRVFERLYRVEESRGRAGGGAGLGLAICRAIVDAHDGRIRAEPSTLGGLRVVVDLPSVRT
jgi:two-component system sensor histidine kinase BaeS